MNKVVLLGSNIAHSRSPLILNTLFAKYGIELHYTLQPITAEDLDETIERMKRGGYRGANITSPHKEVAIRSVERLDAGARVVGAINTIVFESGGATGHNTDIDGFARSISSDPLLHSPFDAAVLGSGGAARAAVFALLENTNLDRVTIYSRSLDRAIAATSRFDDRRVEAALLENFTAANLIVHATPVGLPGREGCLLDDGQLKGGALFYEMIYSPEETALLRAARRAGLRGINGERMLVEQALRSFELWTGITPSADDLPPNLFQLPLSDSQVSS